jgi:tetratricopeptide (TPR) repeat protein
LSQADAWFEEGRSTLQAAPLKQAKEAYLGLVAIAADPVSLECQLARAGLYLSMEEDLIHRRDPAKKFLEEGLQWALKAEKQKPDSAQIHALLGNLYGQKIALGDIFTAMDCGPKSGDENKKALKLDPEDARVQAAQGRMYLNAPGFAGGDVRKALACFKKSLELDPQSDETWVWLSRAYRKLNQPKDRAEALQQALKLNPKNLSARMEQNDLEKSQAH